MRKTPERASLAAKLMAEGVLLVLALSCPSRLAAQQQPHLRVLSSNGVRAVLVDVQSKAEKAIGRKLVMEFSSASTLRQRMESGTAFDVAILTPELIDELTQAGQIVPGSKAMIAAAGIGIGQRAGAAKPDIRTPDAVRKVLLNAKSIAFTKDGQSRPSIDRMFEKLGIAEAAKSKVKLLGAGEPPEAVARGEAELVITLVSEILPVKGVDLIGPLPPDFQSNVMFAAGVSTHAADARSAKAWIEYITSAALAPILKARGMQRP
jgi:molybdate transport system substrate-binding protein